MNAFFALANADKKKAAITSTSVNPRPGVQDTVKDLMAVIVTPTSPPNPKRLLTSALCSGAKDETGPPSSGSTIKDKTASPSLGPTTTDKTTPPAASFSTLTPLGKKRGMSSKKADPPTNSHTSMIDHDMDMGEGEEMEIELPTVKVYPKSSKSANKP